MGLYWNKPIETATAVLYAYILLLGSFSALKEGQVELGQRINASFIDINLR